MPYVSRSARTAQKLKPSTSSWRPRVISHPWSVTPSSLARWHVVTTIWGFGRSRLRCRPTAICLVAMAIAISSICVRAIPKYGLAVDNGLHWLVLRAEVRTKYPEVLSVIQVCRWDMWFLFMSAYPFTLTRPRPKNTPISRYTLARWYTRHIWKGTSTHVRPVIILACVTIFDTHTLAIFSRRTSVRKFLMFMSWAPFLLRTYADVCVSLGICLRDGAGLGKQSPRQTYLCVRVTLPCSLHFSELPDQHACARVLAGGFGISAMASLFVWLPYHV